MAKTPAATKKPEDQTFDEAFDELTKDDAGSPGAAAPAEAAAPAPSAPAAVAPPPEKDPRDTEIERLNGELSLLAQRQRSDSGRFEALEKKLTEMGGTLTEAARARMPSAAQVAAALQSPEGWKQFETDYPDIAKPVLASMNARDQALRTELTKQLEPLVQAKQKADKDAIDRFVDEQTQALTKAHPGYEVVVRSAGFSAWLAKQPPMTQNAMDSPMAADAIKVLNEFKAFQSASQADTLVADVTQQRQQRLEQAATVTGKKHAALQGAAEIPDDYEAAWDEMDRRAAAAGS